MRQKDLPPDEFKTVAWAPFRKAFPIVFGSRDIISLDAGMGWRPLLWRLCEGLEAHAKAQMEHGEAPIQIAQIKSKFGGLRCYLHRHDDVAGALIGAAERVASGTCEACGAPATTRTINGWFSTYCPRHMEAALEWAIRQESRDP